MFYHYVLLQAVVMLPTMFGNDFGYEIGRYATLVDPNHNEFEVLVEKSEGRIYLTKGWGALRDFYDINLGSWVTVVYVGLGKFGMNIKDRFGNLIRYPSFVPPMKFNIDREFMPSSGDILCNMESPCYQQARFQEYCIFAHESLLIMYRNL